MAAWPAPVVVDLKLVRASAKDASRDAAKQRADRLHQLRRQLEEALLGSRTDRLEVRMQFLTDVAHLNVRDPRKALKALTDKLLDSVCHEPAERHTAGSRAGACAQLLQTICEQRAAEATAVLLDTPGILARFFEGHPRRMHLWFAHFSIDGLAAFRLGALALARYALIHRDDVWRHLVWGGKHPQAPIAVAAKPHYFCELDVVATVTALLEQSPGFWASPELRDSVAGGDLLPLDLPFFTQALLGMLHGGGWRAQRVRDLVDGFVAGIGFAPAAAKLLPCLSDADLLSAVCGLLDAPGPQDFQEAATEPDEVMAGLVFGAAPWRTMDEALLAGALALSPVRMAHLLREEEHADALQEVTQLAIALHAATSTGPAQAAPVEDLATGPAEVGVLALVLELWALRLSLAASAASGSLEATLARNGIAFRRSAAEPGAWLSEAGRKRECRHAKGKPRKKKRHRRHTGDFGRSSPTPSKDASDSDGPAGSDVDSQAAAIWILTLDGSEVTCSDLDVVERVIRHALSKWLAWWLPALQQCRGYGACRQN